MKGLNLMLGLVEMGIENLNLNLYSAGLVKLTRNLLQFGMLDYGIFGLASLASGYYLLSILCIMMASSLCKLENWLPIINQ